MLVHFLLLAFVAGPTVAQSPCCAPLQWEGGVSQHFTPNSIFHEAFAITSYDYTNQLVASNQTLIGNRTMSHQRVLVNGKTKTMYVVEHHSMECKIYTLERGMEKPCVPDNFRGDGFWHFGAGSDQFAYKAFRGRVEHLEVVLAVSNKLCVPISQMSFNDKFREVQSYVNVTIGIRDRSVFNVPAECRRQAAASGTQAQALAAFPALRTVFVGL